MRWAAMHSWPAHSCVRTSWEFLAAGASFQEILSDYPALEREDILAAIEYAAHQTDHAVLQAS